jgi:hypothetical protein
LQAGNPGVNWCGEHFPVGKSPCERSTELLARDSPPLDQYGDHGASPHLLGDAISNALLQKLAVQSMNNPTNFYGLYDITNPAKINLTQPNSHALLRMTVQMARLRSASIDPTVPSTPSPSQAIQSACKWPP